MRAASAVRRPAGNDGTIEVMDEGMVGVRPSNHRHDHDIASVYFRGCSYGEPYHGMVRVGTGQ